MKTKIPSAEEGEASEIRVPSPILLATWIELLYARTIRFCGRSGDHDFVLPVFKKKEVSLCWEFPLHEKSGAEIAEESSYTSRSETERNLDWFLPGPVQSLMTRDSKEIRTT
jgi:hypothetical protein